MKLYLSILEVTEEKKGDRPLSKIQDLFINDLTKTDHEYIDSSEFTD